MNTVQLGSDTRNVVEPISREALHLNVHVLWTWLSILEYSLYIGISKTDDEACNSSEYVMNT